MIEPIEKFAKDNGYYQEHEDNCNLRIYFTNKKCLLEEARQALDKRLYKGDKRTKVDCEGCSEYTITGLSLDDFSIGVHDLEQEL